MTLSPLFELAERGHGQGLVHRLGLEAAGVDRRGGQADAVDGDRVALGDLRGEAGGDAHASAILAALQRLDPADVLDQAGEHHHSLKRVSINVSLAPRVDRLGALAPGEQHGRDEYSRLVDLAGVGEGGGKGLDHPRGRDW